MDKVTKYRHLLKQILLQHQALVNRRPTSGVDSELIVDEERDNYLWLSVGWAKGRRVDGTTFFARIRDGKFLIEEDWTEDGIATELIEAGVPPEDIVLAFHEPETNAYTKLAAA